MSRYKAGVDVGSTTAKIAVLDETGQLIFSKYIRHQADIQRTVPSLFDELELYTGEHPVSLSITGSVGMGLAERFGIPFEQEVAAATTYVQQTYPEVSTMIDIGGEDAKIVYLTSSGAADLRMNGNCAGGTGAFIDQMAILLGVSVEELNGLAQQAQRLYPIAARCGVFSKTDIQNLISKQASKADIAASIFHAVAVQTVVTLSHGCDITPRILFCGGPLTFIPALRKAFADYLKLSPEAFITPENAHLIPALGTALRCRESSERTARAWADLLRTAPSGTIQTTRRLPALFDSPETYASWQQEKARHRIEEVPLKDYEGPAYLGIDSGSTTTKIVVTDASDRLLFYHYAPNNGNPIAAVHQGLERLRELCNESHARLHIAGSCSTGYGEDLIRTAFNLGGGIIETIAHYLSARHINPNVSFILDIGGQDMKALFIENHTLCRMEINEACSSGCGSFIETFARSLNYSASDFSQAACSSSAPCDLGTRCTVFMNSKVKQVLREGASVSDIAAGLAYSVARNCLYKVLKIKNLSELGTHIVVQGGTLRNDAVVRAFEQLTGTTVHRSNHPELMGAYGCALHARTEAHTSDTALEQLLQTANYTTRELQCRGCENRCTIQKYLFDNQRVFYSGNKCEQVFSNQGTDTSWGENGSVEKYKLLFNRASEGKEPEGGPLIGIPRCLNMYENYPFWHALFRTAGIRTLLSSPSTYARYESGVHSVMSDNICFPAKLVHSHIYELEERGVDRIFMPYVILEQNEDSQAANSYNCPIVSGYSDVIRSAVNPSVPVDSPVLSFRDSHHTAAGCIAYLKSLGVDERKARQAVRKGFEAQKEYERQVKELNWRIYRKSREEGRLTLLLAGRPYHTDPLVQHKLSELIASMGVSVITEDIVRHDSNIPLPDTHMVSQWSYTNRILKAARWVAGEGSHVHMVEITSFGCGPDAFLLDEAAGLLRRYGKSLTQLKVDDVNNIGSLKLRVRSLIESLKLNRRRTLRVRPFTTTAPYTKRDRKRKILVPYFTDYVSPLLPALFQSAGYELEVLPLSTNDSAECGLRYANNEVCYPATLIVGDLIQALQSGRYDLSETAVAITQTGGQCRASNYLALIKNALVEAGFSKVPVLSLSFGSGLSNEQSGFHINWARLIHITLDVVLFGDCLSKFYHASVVREKEEGSARKLRDYYLEAACGPIRRNDPSGLQKLLSQAARDFDSIVTDERRPRVGVVGEIFLKFNSFAHKNVVQWLIDQKVEVVPPTLAGFFLQGFVNRRVRHETYIKRDHTPTFVTHWIYRKVYEEIERFNTISSAFRYYTPFGNIFEEAAQAESAISLSAQFGEGWLLPAEIISFVRSGVNHVISLQPFGCIANHIIARGIERKIKTLYPELNLLALDFDSGVSDVNIANRLHLMLDHLK